MDHFGIGAGVEGAARVFFQSARGSGRTASLVDSLKDGDRVVFTTEREGRRVQQLCLERGVSIEIVVCDPKFAERLFSRPCLTGDERMLFDHSWVEQFYTNAIERACAEIDTLQTELSGFGEPHRATKRAATEIAKWQR